MRNNEYESSIESELDDLSMMLDELMEMDETELENVNGWFKKAWRKVKRFGRKVGRFAKKAGRFIGKVAKGAFKFCRRNQRLCIKAGKAAVKFIG